MAISIQLSHCTSDQFQYFGTIINLMRLSAWGQLCFWDPDYTRENIHPLHTLGFISQLLGHFALLLATLVGRPIAL